MTISAVLKNVLVFQVDKENFWAIREIQRTLIVVVILVLMITNDLIWLPRSSKLLHFCNTNSTEIGFLFIPLSYRTWTTDGKRCIFFKLKESRGLDIVKHPLWSILGQIKALTCPVIYYSRRFHLSLNCFAVPWH